MDLTDTRGFKWYRVKFFKNFIIYDGLEFYGWDIILK